MLVLTAMMGMAALITRLDLMVHAPLFFGSWFIVAGVAAIIAARRARERTRRYVVGVQLDDDAFAPGEIDLVRRTGDEYDLGLVPGMSGVIEGGRAPLPIEALTRGGPTRVPLPAESKVRIEMGRALFVVRRRCEPVPSMPWAEQWRAGMAAARRFAPGAAAAVALASTMTLLGSVSLAQTSGSVPFRWSNVTPLEQCFRTVPPACHKPGSVAVGVVVGDTGDVRSYWVARSTYERDCPVSQCMANVVSSWSFAPMPNLTKLVLPIEVLSARQLIP